MKFININKEKVNIRTPLAQGMYTWTWVKQWDTIEIDGSLSEYARSLGLVDYKPGMIPDDGGDQKTEPLIVEKSGTIIETKIVKPKRRKKK